MRLLLITKQQLLKIGAAAFAVCFGVMLGLAALQNTAFAEERRLPIYSVQTDEKKIAITFDCAWTDSDLAEITQTLKAYDAPATFFVTGQWCEDYPDAVRALAAAGHGIGNHSDTHPHVAELSKKALEADTAACDEKIKAATGEVPTLYRAPYGEYDNDLMTLLQDGMGKQVIQWDVDSRDWKETATEESIVKNVVEHVQNGSIALFHVDAKAKHTAGALNTILDTLKKDGFSFVLVGDLLIDGDFTVDPGGRMIKK